MKKAFILLFVLLFLLLSMTLVSASYYTRGVHHSSYRGYGYGHGSHYYGPYYSHYSAYPSPYYYHNNFNRWIRYNQNLWF